MSMDDIEIMSRRTGRTTKMLREAIALEAIGKAPVIVVPHGLQQPISRMVRELGGRKTRVASVDANSPITPPTLRGYAAGALHFDHTFYEERAKVWREVDWRHG
jgi:hypothetical protein